MRSASFAAFLLSAALPSIATALTAESSTFEPLAARAVGSPEAFAELQLAARDLNQDPNAEHLQKRFWGALLTAVPSVIQGISSLFGKKGKRDEAAELLARYIDTDVPQVAARGAPVHLPPGLAANVLAVYDQSGKVVYDKTAKPAKRSAPAFGEVLTSFDLTKNLAEVKPEGIQRRDPAAPPAPAPAGAEGKVMALFNDDGSLIGYYPPKTSKRDLPAGAEEQAQAMALFNDDGSLVGVYPKNEAQKRDVDEADVEEADFEEASAGDDEAFTDDAEFEEASADEADSDEADVADADFENIVEKRDSLETFVQDAMAADAAEAEAETAETQEESLVRRVVGMRGAPIGFRA
ncbi:hypothetical protein GGTG_08858 [Gaeumannomyces tritici R3-111a-1]|uniref:Uncharacterized protein n=1 Tax=Gaeumannomyces tritici (strain R3-111a-1) TaxID=644352 RepID=J3P5R8_GAET3|nr:hypothetical protein GGTG_08858 [Gaeumannomyces tritici R3-111a-1]EJT75020.1 hypothetical protein GGTG_08858 [Gaeumannomyces tritici R3-111a-1]